jgi:hypothetical protein
MGDNNAFSFGDGAGNDTAFSVGAWCYMDDATRFRMIQKADASGEWLFGTDANDKLTCFAYKSGYSAYVGRSYNTALTGDQGAWHHYMMTYSGGKTAGSFKLYRDGVQVDDTNIAVGVYAGMSNTADSMQIGKSGATYSNGRQQATFLANAELSTADVAELYNGGAGAFYKDLSSALKAKMVAFWDMVETTGQIYDATGNGYVGTDNNTVTSAAGKVTYTAEDASLFAEATQEYLSISDAAQTGLSTGDLNDDFYVAGWANLRALDSGDTCWMWLKLNNSFDAGYEWGVRYENNNNRFQGILGIDTTEYLRVYWDDADFETFGKWRFVEFWVDASAKTGYMSVNRGTPTTASWTGTAMRAGTRAFQMGIDEAIRVGNNWDGRMANVVFIHGIPTDSERAALFGRGFGCDVSDRPTLSTATYVSWWKLDEASGTRYDSIGSNDLTDNNTVTGGDGVVYNVPAVATGQYMTMNAGFW